MQSGSRVTVTTWRPHADQPEETSLWGELRTGAHPGDVLAIATVPALLVTTFAVVGGRDLSLALSYAQPTPTTLVTAHFVHRSLAHLVDNLAAYALVVPVAYALAVLGGGRREFVVAFVGYLLLLPVVISALGLLVFDRGVTLGFSGVTMAFVGLVPLQAGAYLEDRFAGAMDGHLDVAIFFGGLALVALRTVSPVGPRLALAGLGVAVAVVSVRGTVGSLPPLERSLDGLRSDAGQLGAAGLFVLVVGLVAGFPSGADAGPVVVNGFGHFVGYVVGFVAPYVAFRVLASPPVRTESSPEAG